jgi:hypothetical protein
MISAMEGSLKSDEDINIINHDKLANHDQI